MRFVSTRGQAPPATLREALFSAVAPDGGLYMPEALKPLPPSALARVRGASLTEAAIVVGRHLFGDDLDADTLRSIVESSLDFPIPLVAVEEDAWALELFHGPTAAFKDVGARFLARLMVHFLEGDHDGRVTILVATSGDTGSAVARAFHRLPNIRVVVLFPRGQVSPQQRKLFTTLGGNVDAMEVAGTFDDCQRLVKDAFRDVAVRASCRLTTGNSINVGRLLPQMFYYFHAVGQLPAGARDRSILMATPSGNFGNLTAGVMAKRLGLGCHRFVAATNVNDVFPRFLAAGRLEPRPSRRTIASAMDVGDPNNVERILSLYRDDIDAIRADIVGSAHTDDQARAAIRRVHRSCGYTMDPHTAFGYLGLRQALQHEEDRGAGIFLATAHPAKFPDVVQGIIEAAVPIPPQLGDCLTLREGVTPLEPNFARLREYLLET